MIFQLKVTGYKIKKGTILNIKCNYDSCALFHNIVHHKIEFLYKMMNFKRALSMTNLR